MIQCLFHCTWGKIRILCLGLQEPSKLVLSTSLLTSSLSFFLSYLPLLPSHQTWSPSQTLAILPASHACVTLLCLSSCSKPCSEPPPTPSLPREEPLVLRTQHKHSLLRRLSVSPSPQPGQTVPCRHSYIPCRYDCHSTCHSVLCFHTRKEHMLV